MKVDDLPEEEKNFQRIYVKAPSFLSIHMGVKDTVVLPNTDCHHFILEVFGSFPVLGWSYYVERKLMLKQDSRHMLILLAMLYVQDDWGNLEKPCGSIFLSIPTVLDSSLAPEGHHILHIFTTSCIEDWKVNLSIKTASITFLISDIFKMEK